MYRAYRIPAFAACLFCLVLSAGSATADTTLLRERGITVLGIHEGDRCLVSGILLDDTGIAFVYRGRRVTLHPDAVGVFLSRPDPYFSKLQPRGALFQEDASWSLGISWLVFGIWMTLGLASGAAASHLALRKGRSAGFWFAAGVALNVIALATLLTRPSLATAELPPRFGKVPLTVRPTACPSCGAPNHPTAARCSSCRATLDPRSQSEVARAGAQSP